jgi:hypothetical protein
VNDTPAEVTNLPSKLLWGEAAIEEEILGLRFRVRPNAFLQTNTEMAEKLYETAREFAALTGEQTVYDLYCGTGTIGLLLFVGLLLALCARFAHYLRRDDDALAVVGVVGLSLIAGFVAKNMTDDFLFRSNAKEFWALLALLVGFGTRLELREAGSLPASADNGTNSNGGAATGR